MSTQETLQKHLQVCDELYQLALEENRHLKQHRRAPEAASLEFAGRQAIADAYAQDPPDDQIDLTGEPIARGEHVTVGFAWRRDQSAGVLDFVLSTDLISALTVIFG